MKRKIEIGDETVEVSAHYEVCPRCDGRGKHDPEAFSQGFTALDFSEDPDFAEGYFAG